MDDLFSEYFGSFFSSEPIVLSDFKVRGFSPFFSWILISSLAARTS